MMTRSQSRVGSGLAWYVVWSAMLLMAAWKAFATRPIVSGNMDFCVSSLLALTAGILILAGSQRLRKQSAFSAVLLLLFCNAQFLQFALSKRPPSHLQGVDFSAYYLAGKVLSQEHYESIYHLPYFADGRMNLNGEAAASSSWHALAVRDHVPFAAPYIYPPLVAILMRPLVNLSFSWAYRLWTVMTLLLVFASVLMLLRMTGTRLDGRLALLLGVGLLSYSPLLENLYFGQMGGVILFLLTSGLWALSEKRSVLSALCYAIATFIKLTPVLAVPILIFHRRWRWLIAYAAGLFSLLLFSAWQAGWSAQQQFWNEVLPSISSGAPGFPNLSIVAFAKELLARPVPLLQTWPLAQHGFVELLPRAIALLVYLLLLGRCALRRHQGDLLRDLVVIGLVTLVVSPIAWTHHFTVALLPLLYLWLRMPQKINLLLSGFVIAVGTNFISMLRAALPWTNASVILAAIVPGLTIVLAYAALSETEESAVERSVSRPDLASAGSSRAF